MSRRLLRQMFRKLRFQMIDDNSTRLREISGIPSTFPATKTSYSEKSLDVNIGTALASAPTWVEVKRAKAMHESEWREPVVVLPLTGFSKQKPRGGEETDTFFVDESWLKLESTQSRQPREGLSTLSDREVEIIEAALAA